MTTNDVLQWVAIILLWVLSILDAGRLTRLERKNEADNSRQPKG